MYKVYLESTAYKLKEKSSLGCWFDVQIHKVDFVLKSFLGLIAYLIIEAPICKILEIVWRRNKKSEAREELVKLI